MQRSKRAAGVSCAKKNIQKGGLTGAPGDAGWLTCDVRGTQYDASGLALISAALSVTVNQAQTSQNPWCCVFASTRTVPMDRCDNDDSFMLDDHGTSAGRVESVVERYKFGDVEIYWQKRCFGALLQSCLRVEALLDRRKGEDC